MLSEKQAKAVVRAIIFLADRCDGARDLDGQGFNKLDTEFGHRMAALAKRWMYSDDPIFSEKQLGLMKLLAIKYRKQLPEEILDNV
jgi:hypothetical protein